MRPRSRGLTLVELMVALAVASIIGLVVVGIFRAGVLAWTYGIRQTSALSSARKAILGDGSKIGLSEAVQESDALLSLSSSSLSVHVVAGSSMSYSISNGVLYQAQLGVPIKLADGLTSLQVTYYNLASNGRIMESTSAASAAFAAFLLTSQSASQKTYTFYGGAALRNRP